MEKMEIAQRGLKGAFLWDFLGCAVVQLHMPAHAHSVA
jgi:hypothetical protein